MKADVMKSLTNEQLERAKFAYLELRDIYEERAGGVYAAMNEKEYLVIRATIAKIDQIFHERITEGGNNGR